MTMHERDLERVLVDEAKKHGWMRYHVPDSRRTEAGFPDEVLLHPGAGRLVIAELKTDGGAIKPAQRVWLEGLGRVKELGHPPEVYVWRPKRMQAMLDTLRSVR
ncbi:MAG: VRR-NUC domain-containing protein [Solirubrobacteraceae bacterium]